MGPRVDEHGGGLAGGRAYDGPDVTVMLRQHQAEERGNIVGAEPALLAAVLPWGGVIFWL